MKAWSYWFPDLLPLVPGVPNLLAKQELLRAAQAFFAATKSWKVIEAARPVTAGTSTIDATPLNTGMEMVEIRNVNYDGKDLELMSLEGVRAKYGEGWETRTGTPGTAVIITPASYRLFPIPDQDATTGAVHTIAVSPSDSATGVQDDLAVMFRDAILAGAVARLKIKSGMPWSDPAGAASYGAAFDSACGVGQIKAARGFSRARISARPQWQ